MKTECLQFHSSAQYLESAEWSSSFQRGKLWQGLQLNEHESYFHLMSLQR